MKLRYYQEEAVQSIFNYFESNKGNPVVAAPTASGKSLIIAEFVKRAITWYPQTRIMMITHVKELIQQNAAKLAKLWPEAPIGIYSAGLNRKDTNQSIIFAGIASVNANPEYFGHRDLVLVDECHLISQKESSMYQKVITKLKEINPYLKVIGLTATPFRQGQGMITDDGLFTDICYNLCGMEPFNKLVAEGFIAPLIPKRTSTQLDFSSVGLAQGDYKNNELQAAVDVAETTYLACKEMVEYAHDRHSCLVFATGIEHCEHVVSTLQSMGESATCVHSKMSTGERDQRLADFATGVYKWMVNNGVLTTGYDAPWLDFGGILRPTMSVSLWIQMIGRFVRPYDGADPNFPYQKSNALILDFAGNTPRLGPINDPTPPRKKGQATGDAPIRICDKCGVYNHASARFCCGCLAEFTFQSKLQCEAGTEELIKQEIPIIESFNVSRVIISPHQKKGSQKVLQVNYYCGLRCFKEFVAIEHQGFAKKRAEEWWFQRTSEPFPETVEIALRQISRLKVPAKIRVITNKKYPEVISHEY